MTEVESPAALVAARAESLARATDTRLGESPAVERPRALGSGFGADDVGLPSLVATLVGGAASESAVQTGVAVEALDRQGQVLATVLDGAAECDRGSATDDVAGLLLWSDWLHARSYQLLLETAGSEERVVSAVRTMGQEVVSRNGSRTRVDGSVTAVSSVLTDEDDVSVIVRGGGCSCASAARIGGLVGGVGTEALVRATAYGESIDDLVRADGRSAPHEADTTTRSHGVSETGAGGPTGKASRGEGSESTVSASSPESVCWPALRWLQQAVDGAAVGVGQ